MLSAMETMMKAHPAAREREKVHCMGNAGGSGDKFESSVS